MAKLETLKRVLLYLSAPVAVAAATKARQLLDPMLQDTSIFLAYVPAVALVAWLAGGGPGVLAMVLTALVGRLFGTVV